MQIEHLSQFVKARQPISICWTFSLGVTAEALRPNIASKSAISPQRGQVDLQFQVEGVAPPTILLLRELG